jgi:hypothetical protein
MHKSQCPPHLYHAAIRVLSGLYSALDEQILKDANETAQSVLDWSRERGVAWGWAK